MRAYASASISLGAVNVPVKLFAATEAAAEITFNRLHKICGGKLQQQSYCEHDAIVVEKDDMVRGYEYEKNKFVQFTEAEIEQLKAEDSKTIEIDSFVKLSSIDMVHFDKRCFLGPDKGAGRAYKLLARAMTKANRVAVARYAARGKQYLVLLLAVGDMLVMQHLYYADEVRSLGDVPIDGDAPVAAADLKLALQLIRKLERPHFDASLYRDEVKDRLLERIQAKIEGREVSIAPSEKPGAQIIDLKDALEASLDKRRRDVSGSSGVSSK